MAANLKDPRLREIAGVFLQAVLSEDGSIVSKFLEYLVGVGVKGVRIFVQEEFHPIVQFQLNRGRWFNVLRNDAVGSVQTFLYHLASKICSDFEDKIVADDGIHGTVNLTIDLLELKYQFFGVLRHKELMRVSYREQDLLGIPQMDMFVEQLNNLANSIFAKDGVTKDWVVLGDRSCISCVDFDWIERSGFTRFTSISFDDLNGATGKLSPKLIGGGTLKTIVEDNEDNYVWLTKDVKPWLENTWQLLTAKLDCRFGEDYGKDDLCGVIYEIDERRYRIEQRDGRLSACGDYTVSWEEPVDLRGDLKFET